MKKNLFIITALLSIIGTVSYAAMPTEKDIGPCTARNAMGFCSESKTHYCAQFGSNGRCTVWYSKSKSTYENAVNQINSFDEAINKAIEKQGKEQKIRDAKEKALLEKKENLKKSTIPTSIAICNSIADIRQEMGRLSARENAGIDVSTEMNILDYKYQKLFSLPNYSIEFDKAYSALSNGVITQLEFDNLMNKLKVQDKTNSKAYQEIMSATSASIIKSQLKDELLNQGKSYIPVSKSNWIKNGANMLEMLK